MSRLTSPAAIEARHWLHHAAEAERKAREPETTPPPRHERATRILAWIVIGLNVGWFGGHLLIGALS